MYAALIFKNEPKEVYMKLLDICGTYENEYLRQHGGTLYPNLRPVMENLKESGYHLYIVSNCQAGYIEAFLDHYGFWHYFKDIECYGNNDLPKSENIKKIVERNNLTKAVYVGDIQGDYDATMAAGLPFIHAAYGFGTIAQETAGVDSFAELVKVVPEVLGE